MSTRKLQMIALAAGAAAILNIAPAQQNQPAELHTLHVQGNVYMIVGAGGNVTVQVGNDGVLLVDSGLAQNADKLIAEVRKLSNGPIRYLINTHVHPDHTGGNEKIAPAGSTIAGGNVVGNIGESAGKGAAGSIVAMRW